PIIDELSKSYEGTGVKILKANVDECSELTSKFGIRSIPTIVVLKNGIEEGRINGASGSVAKQIEELVNKINI
ncbi:MAG TPA: thioredoxin domain-containing protein, partial [Candidatus Paceibacterota bacterium]|nr:thioredoxin domain-containing protein [Candidatus Paceibacterota bacterium]